MASAVANVKTLISAHRVQAEAAGVSLLALAFAIAIGTSARRSARAVDADLVRLRGAEEELAGFRAAFRPGTAQDDSIRLPESLTVAVTHEVRLSLAQRVAATAEESGLSDVRVRFAGIDSAVAPTVPQLAANSPTIADYTLAVDAGGRFSSLLSLVNHLPPSVALQRVRVVRATDGHARYQIILAVFEMAGQNQHG